MVIMEDLEAHNIDSESGSSDYEAVENPLKRKTVQSGENNKKAKSSDEDLLEEKPIKNKNELYKQPTAEELNRLRETENLFNSNIFRLQIDELISEINVKPKHVKQFEKWFETFDTFIQTLPDFGDIPLNDFKKINKKKLTNQQKFITSSIDDLTNPLFLTTDSLVMKFNKPSTTFTFGRFKYNSDIRTNFHVNLCLTIPKNSFYEKDYLNNKYLIKRYYYLIYVLYHLKQNDEYKNVVQTFYLNNEWLPILIITPKFSEKVKINIFVAAQDDTFKLARFLPNKNNIKQNIFTINHFNDVNVDTFSSDGTKLYNSLLLHDFTLLENNKLMETMFRHLKNVQDGIKLLTVWLTQRHLNIGYRSFTNDLLVYICLYLTIKKKINKHMSSYQVIRIFWSFLSSSDLTEETLSICEDIKKEDLELFKNNFDVVLIDSTGSCNVAAFLDLSIYLKTKSEAAMALDNLDNNRFNTFSALFTTKMPFAVQYDAILKICSNNNFDNIYKKCSQKDKFTYLGHYNSLIRNYILNCLKKGLSSRILNLVPFFSEHIESDKLIFGITLNPQHFSDVIERGPKQYEAGAEDFKKFWGTQAELRRFKDSSIYEAVYFKDAKTIQDKRLIYSTIIKFVMKEKLQLAYELHGNEMEKLLNIESIISPFPIGSNEEATLKIKSSHYEISRMLRELKLPLGITAVQGVSDVFSYTDVFPPIATNYRWGKKVSVGVGQNILIKDDADIGMIPRLVSPIECVIQLALHSKWPRNLEALRAMKTTFYFEICKLLKDEHQVISTVGNDYIDIFYTGLVYRMRLYHPKEAALLKKDITSEGVTFYKDTEESLELERNLELLPRIAGALNGIQQESPCFGPSTSLIKRWLRSQMIDNFHISDVVINLLNASLFLTSEPFNKPTLPQIGFLRFLRFISEYDFNLQPVLVNFNNDMTKDELNEIETKFLQNRHNYSNLYIITPYDESKSVFTKSSPTIDILRRVSFLARETYKYLLKCTQGDQPLKYKPLFIPNLEGYNALINLKPLLNPRRYQQVTADNSNPIQIEEFNPKTSTKIPVVGFNPVDLYLNELRKNYGDYALFFHDFYGGNTIGVLWIEKALEIVDFKISTINARKRSTSQFLLNTDALLEDFYILGKGLVRNIDNLQNK